MSYDAKLTETLLVHDIIPHKERRTKMKKSLLSVGAASLAIAMFATGCGTPGNNAVAEANEFIAGAETYKTHKVQKDEMANVLLNSSEQLYLLVGGAVADIAKIRYGESDVILLRQNVGYETEYYKEWDKIKKNTANSATAKENLLKAISQNLSSNPQYQKRTSEQYFAIIEAKIALDDYTRYCTAAKEKQQDEIKMDAWLAKGKAELKNSYTDDYKKAEAKRAEQMNKSLEHTKAELTKMGNKVMYLGLWVTASAIKDDANVIMKKTKETTVAQMKKMEAEYPYVTEVLDPILKLKTDEERMAYAKDLLTQYKYVVEIALGRLAYTGKALPWYYKSKEALDVASMKK